MTSAFVMVGAPGAGKSTFAKKLAKEHNAIILSGDDIRAELFGSVEIQGNWFSIWDRIVELVEGYADRNVILDGTYYREDYRAEATTMLRSYGYYNVEAVVVNPSLATCLARNFQRADRNVPDYVIREMHEKLQRSLGKIGLEDFDKIHYVP